MRYYVAGLSYAGSNYAYFTIGSVIAFTVDSYVSVRGFPKRNAGEDFYLLNKLAKQGQVAWLKSIKVSLQARLSDRVPFGTGPAVNEIIRNAEKGHSYHYYHPEIFEQLKALMAAFNDLPKYRYFYNEWLNKLSTPNQSCLQSMDFESFIIKQKQVSDAQLLKQLHVWFDAFKTLKYVHYLRDNYFDNIPLLQAINQAKFNIDTTKATLD